MGLMDLVCDDCFLGRTLLESVIVMSAVNGMVYAFLQNWCNLR